MATLSAAVGTARRREWLALQYTVHIRVAGSALRCRHRYVDGGPWRPVADGPLLWLDRMDAAGAGIGRLIRPD